MTLKSSATILTAVLMSALVVGCIVIPYTPEAEIQHDSTALGPHDDVLITIGPRTFLERFGQTIMKKNKRIVILDGLQFRDTAFPEGNSTLAQLLLPETANRLAGLNADYLVLVGALSTSGTDDLPEGVNVWVGFYGIGSSKAEANLSALLVDLREGKLVERLTAEAEGTSSGVGLFYGVFIMANPGKGAVNGLAEAVASGVTGLIPDGPVRIALMAAESRRPGSDPMKPRTNYLSSSTAGTGDNMALAAYRRWYKAEKNSTEMAAKALQDLCEAANAGYEPALLDLTELFMTDRAAHLAAGTAISELIVPDDPVAYMWHSLWAGENEVRLTLRDDFADRLSPEQIAKAKEYHKNWGPGQCPLPE